MRISRVSDRGAVYMAAVVESHIYLSRGSHNSFFESRGGIVPCVGIKGRFLVVWSQKAVYIFVFAGIRAKMETGSFYFFLMATSVKRAMYMDPGSGLIVPGVYCF